MAEGLPATGEWFLHGLLQRSGHRPFTLEFHPTLDVLASGGHDRDGRLHTWSRSNAAWVLQQDSLWRSPGRRRGYFIDGITFADDGNLLIANNRSDTGVRLFEWSVDEEAWLASGSLGTEGFLQVTVSSDGLTLAMAANSVNGVEVWALNNDIPESLGWTLQASLVGPVRPVWCAVFDPAGTLLAAGGSGSVRLWQRPTPTSADWTQLQDLQGYVGFVESLAFHPSGSWLASGSRDSTVLVWSLDPASPDAPWGLDATLTGYSDQVNDVRFSPSGDVLAAAGTGGPVRLWGRTGSEPAAWATVAVLESAGGDGLAFHHSGHLLATGGGGSSGIQLWGRNAPNASIATNVSSVKVIGEAEATLTVTLGAPPARQVELTVVSSDTSMIAVSPAILTFTPADWDQLRTVVIEGVGALEDGQPTATAVTIAIDATTAADPITGYAAVPSVIVSALRLSAPRLVASQSTLTVAEAGGTAAFTVALSIEPLQDVTLDVASDDLDQVTVIPSSLVFTVGNWETPQTVTVTGVGNDQVDGNRATTVTVAVDDGTDTGYSDVSPVSVAVSVVDDDVAGLVVSESALTVAEAGGTATFTVALLAQPLQTVTLDVASDDLNQVTAIPASLIFATDDWETPQMVTVTGVGNDQVDGNRATTVTVAVDDGTDTGYSNVSPVSVAVSVVDDDVAGLAVSKSTLIVSEAGGTSTFTVALAAQPLRSVTIEVTAAGADLMAVAPTSLEFTVDNWEIPRTVTVTGVNNERVDSNRATTVTVAVDDGTDTGYSDVDPVSVAVTVTNDDVLAGQIAIPPVFVSASAGLLVELASAMNSLLAAIHERSRIPPNWARVHLPNTGTLSVSGVTLSTQDPERHVEMSIAALTRLCFRDRTRGMRTEALQQTRPRSTSPSSSIVDVDLSADGGSSWTWSSQIVISSVPCIADATGRSVTVTLASGRQRALMDIRPGDGLRGDGGCVLNVQRVLNQDAGHLRLVHLSQGAMGYSHGTLTLTATHVVKSARHGRLAAGAWANRHGPQSWTALRPTARLWHVETVPYGLMRANGVMVETCAVTREDHRARSILAASHQPCKRSGSSSARSCRRR